MGILFNSTALGIHFCETSLIFNFKTRLGGEICLCDVNMHKGYFIMGTCGEICSKKSEELINCQNRTCKSVSHMVNCDTIHFHRSLSLRSMFHARRCQKAANHEPVGL